MAGSEDRDALEDGDSFGCYLVTSSQRLGAGAVAVHLRPVCPPSVSSFLPGGSPPSPGNQQLSEIHSHSCFSAKPRSTTCPAGKQRGMIPQWHCEEVPPSNSVQLRVDY